MRVLLLIVVGLIALGFVVIYIQNSRVPRLGHSDGQLKPLSTKPNAVSTQTEQTDKRVEPWPFKASREATVEAILQAVNDYGGAEIREQEPNYLYVVFTTPLMKFHDDAEFYLDETEQRVHFRSSSRAGHSDRGLNRQRYERLTELYNDADV